MLLLALMWYETIKAQVKDIEGEIVITFIPLVYQTKGSLLPGWTPRTSSLPNVLENNTACFLFYWVLALRTPQSCHSCFRGIAELSG